MNDQSYWTTCSTSFLLKTATGAAAGFITSFLFRANKRAFTVWLFAGVGSGIATRDCEKLFNRAKIN